MKAGGAKTLLKASTRLGPLMGGPQCHMSLLRNGNVTSLCCLFSTMSHVEIKRGICPMSLHLYPPYHMSLSPMSHVEFKKWPCYPVDSRG